jgi:putative flippase GtrA
VHTLISCDSTLRAGREYYNASSIAKRLCSILVTEDWSKLVSLKLSFRGAMMRLTQMHALIDALCTVTVAAIANCNDSNSSPQQQQQQHGAVLYRLEVREQRFYISYASLRAVSLCAVSLFFVAGLITAFYTKCNITFEDQQQQAALCVLMLFVETSVLNTGTACCITLLCPLLTQELELSTTRMHEGTQLHKDEIDIALHLCHYIANKLQQSEALLPLKYLKLDIGWSGLAHGTGLFTALCDKAPLLQSLVIGDMCVGLKACAVNELAAVLPRFSNLQHLRIPLHRVSCKQLLTKLYQCYTFM